VRDPPGLLEALGERLLGDLLDAGIDGGHQVEALLRVDPAENPPDLS
jgi:hypothetical protein